MPARSQSLRRTNIYLDEQQTEQLDRLASGEGISRAELIRRLIDRGLDGQTSDVVADLAWIDASFGSVLEFDVPERGAGARERHLDSVAASDS